MSAFHSPQSLEERSENLPDPNHREQQIGNYFGAYIRALGSTPFRAQGFRLQG